MYNVYIYICIFFCSWLTSADPSQAPSSDADGHSRRAAQPAPASPNVATTHDYSPLPRTLLLPHIRTPHRAPPPAQSSPIRASCARFVDALTPRRPARRHAGGT